MAKKPPKPPKPPAAKSANAAWSARDLKKAPSKPLKPGQGLDEVANANAKRKLANTTVNSKMTKAQRQAIVEARKWYKTTSVKKAVNARKKSK